MHHVIRGTAVDSNSSWNFYQTKPVFCLLDCFGSFAILIDQILLGVLSNALEIIIVKDGCMIEEHVTSERKHLFDQFCNKWMLLPHCVPLDVCAPVVRQVEGQ